MLTQIDLNSDVGESFGRWRLGEDGIFTVISSANIACGFHAGDASTMAASCALAASHGVSVGAHVGYRDLAGFGRRFIDVDPAELADETAYQIGALQAMAAREGTRVRYVKPHGGLYNAMVHHEAQARAVIEAVASVDASLPILLLPGSLGIEIAREAGLRAVSEAFADRAYNPDGTLVNRREPGAVLHNLEDITRHVENIANGFIEAIDGTRVRVEAESICVHGDTPGALEIARRVATTLQSAGVRIEPFA